ncbi:MAG: hypothetical protein AB7H93_06590 [Vicinamibacterales bacterium]
MARPTWAVTAAVATCGILAALSGVTAATTVVSFMIDDTFPALVAGGAAAAPGVTSDGLAEDGAYADYRIDPTPPLNWCVDAAPYSQGLLFVRLNRKLDGDAGVLRCTANLNPNVVSPVFGIQRNVTLTINSLDACDRLAEPDAGLPVKDSANADWNLSAKTLPCTLSSNHNPRIRLETLYKARAKATPIHFQTEMFEFPVSYVIQSEASAGIASVGNVKEVSYTGTYRLVRYAPGSKPKTVGPAFTMPVRMTLVTHPAP